jgi:hypothetical protein
MMNAAMMSQKVYRLWLFSILFLLMYTTYVTFLAPTDTLYLPVWLLEPAAVMWDYFYGSYAFLIEILDSGHSTRFIGFLWVFSVVGIYILFSFVCFVLCRLLLRLRANKSIAIKAL